MRSQKPEARSQKTEGATRREFVQILGAGLLIAVLEGTVEGQARGGGKRGGGGGSGPATVAGRLHIGKDGAITLMVGKVEAGQGARAELAMTAAEELRVPVERITVIMADTGVVPNDGITAGSGTTPRTVPAVAQAAAAARELLVAAAVKQWGLTADKVEVKEGKVVETGGKRELSYGELAGADEKLLEQSAPAGVTVTAVKQWQVMGTAVARPNSKDLVTGGHKYPSDIQRPGMLYGKVLRAPRYGAKGAYPIDMITEVGVVVAREGDFFGVAAPTSMAAGRAVESLGKATTWSGGEDVSSEGLFDYLEKHAKEKAANPFAEEVKGAAKSLKSTYQVAYAQHSPLEPRAAVAEWEGGKLTVWTGTQNPFGVRSELAKAFGLGEEAVRVIVPDFGGGFGGKHTGECAVEAAKIAKAAGKAVSLRWTREEEFTWAYFRPAGVIVIEAGLDDQGKLTSWHHVNINSGQQAMDTPYKAGKAKSQYVQSVPPLRHGSYRALASTANTFGREVAMDELAVLAGKDPLEFRLNHLEDGRLKAVLEEAAKRFDWGNRVKKKEAGKTVGVGVACGTEKGSYLATCAEVEIVGGEIRVRRVTQVFECGAIVNPGNLMSQVQGAIVMGLGPTLREGMAFKNGMVTNASFMGYRVPRFADLPILDVHLLNRQDLPSAGAGETPIIGIAPAVANAVFQATGKRVRSMPIRLEV